MAASGGMGTLNPPSDSDDIAKVTPLRRRDPHLAVVPPVRDALPAESSVWDTGELGEPRLRRSRLRQIRSALTIGWSTFRSKLATPRPRPAASGGIVLACVAAVTAVALVSGSGPVTRPHRTMASSLARHASSSVTVSRPAAHPVLRPTRHQAQHRVGHAAPPRRTRDDTRRGAGKYRSANTSGQAQAVPIAPTTTTETPPSSTSASTSSGPASTAGASSDTTQSGRPGPTGSGAAFGPGY
jgi:hypothetical protein